MNVMIDLIGALLISVYLLAMLILVQLKRDNTIGNFTWGGGVLILTLYTFIAWSLKLPRQILVTSLIAIWAFRLLVYIYSRYKKGTDARFISWQQQWGSYALAISFAWIVIMQGTLMVVMAYPSVLTNLTNVQPPLQILDFIGIICWVIGFLFESIGDYQLYIFRKNHANKDKIMDQGLWRYTRHPNYFGEITMWWSLFLIVLSVPNGYAAIIAPLTITFLLVFVTGVPLVERVFINNPEYQAYKKRTSMLIPWFPKS